jgi:hypothetical protein
LNKLKKGKLELRKSFKISSSSRLSDILEADWDHKAFATIRTKIFKRPPETERPLFDILCKSPCDQCSIVSMASSLLQYFANDIGIKDYFSQKNQLIY